MRLPVPDPRDAFRALERGAESVEQLLAAVPKVLTLVDQAGALLTRVDELMDRIEETRAAADEVVRRSNEVVGDAERIVTSTTSLTDRLSPLLDSVEPSLVKLQPTLERLAETTDPREVDAMVALVDLLPGLAAKMETDVIPVLDSLSTVAPDVHDLLDVTREVNEMLGSVPGLGRIKRRVEEEQAAAGRG